MKRRSFWLFLIPLVFLGVFFFFPIISILATAWQGKNAGWITSASQITQPLFFTFFQAALSVFLTLVVGIPAAYLFSHFKVKGSSVLQILTTLPFILPTVIVAAGFNALLGPNGWLNSLLVSIFNLPAPPIHFLGTFSAILIAHIFYNTTIIIRVVGSAWRELNQRFEQAGQTLGASPLQVFREITLPLLLPAIFSASLLVFLFDFTSFGVILLLGGPAFSTLETEIYTQSMYLLNLPLAGVLSVIQLACTLGMTVLINRLSGKWGATFISRLAGDASQKVKGFFQKLFVGGYSILLFLFFGSPLVSLFVRSFLNEKTPSNAVTSALSLVYYQELFINRRSSIFFVPPIQAILNSLLFALATTVISLALGMLSVYALQRKGRITRVLDPILMLPLGASAVTLGLGFVITFGQLPQALSIFPFLIPIVHSLVAYPFVVRTIQPALSAIPDSIHSAAATLGASPRRIFWHVDLPILRRPLFVASLFAFAISLGEFGATVFLARPEFPTIPVAIYRFLSQPGGLNYGQAMAMATILMVLCTACILIMELVLPMKGNQQMQTTGAE